MLKEFYQANPNKSLNGKRWNYKENLSSLHSLQRAHHEGSLNLYAPIQAHTEEWVHLIDRKTKRFIRAYPKLGTRKRNDLPPVAVQWQQAYSASCKG